ncbi:MAG: hypothetical protein R3C14_15225 [Caldilineaceae bacterium]
MMSQITESERSILQKLATFRGGFTHEAAQVVAGASDATLTALTQQSLIHVYPNGRYGAQALLSQDSADPLPEEVVKLQDAHSEFYCAFLAQRTADLKGARQQAALAEIEADSENVRAAWQWAVEHTRIERLSQALDSLGLFYLWQNRLYEGEAMCQLALTRLAPTLPSVEILLEAQGVQALPLQHSLIRFAIRACLWVSLFHRHLNQDSAAQHVLRQARSWLGHPLLTGHDARFEQAQLLYEEAEIAYGVDRKEARSLAEQSLTIFRTLNEPWYIARGIDLVVRGLQPLGLLVRARALTEEGAALRQILGDVRGVGESLKNLSHIARWEGNFDEAEALIQQSIALFTALNAPDQRANAVHTRIGILVYGGKFAEGLQVSEEPRAVYRALGLAGEPVTPTVVSAFALMHLGSYEEAEARFNQALSFYPNMGGGYIAKNLGCVAMVRAIVRSPEKLRTTSPAGPMGQNFSEKLYDEAHAYLMEALALFRKTEDMNGLGQTLGCLGIVMLQLGDLPQARHYIHENLQLAADTLIILPSMTALAGLALLRAQEGDSEAAVELYTIALQIGHVANSRWYHDVIGKHIAAAAESLPAEVAAAAQRRGQRRDWRVRVQGLLAGTMPT